VGAKTYSVEGSRADVVRNARMNCKGGKIPDWYPKGAIEVMGGSIVCQNRRTVITKWSGYPDKIVKIHVIFSSDLAKHDSFDLGIGCGRRSVPGGEPDMVLRLKLMT
jgi:hypothetical protein